MNATAGPVLVTARADLPDPLTGVASCSDDVDLAQHGCGLADDTPEVRSSVVPGRLRGIALSDCYGKLGQGFIFGHWPSVAQEEQPSLVVTPNAFGYPDQVPSNYSHCKGRPQFVYVMGSWSSGVVKIGVTGDLRARRSALQAGYPGQLDILWFTAGSRTLEQDGVSA